MMFGEPDLFDEKYAPMACWLLENVGFLPMKLLFGKGVFLATLGFFSIFVWLPVWAIIFIISVPLAMIENWAKMENL